MEDFHINTIDSHVGGSKKQEILLFLKKHGSTDLKTLSKSLELTKMGILKNLNVLEELGYVERETEKAKKGRPKVFFKLTDSSKDTLFPNNYSDLTNYFLSYIEQNYGIEAVKKALQDRTKEITSLYKEEMVGDTLEQRVTSLRKLRDKDGYMAEQQVASAESFQMLEFNCPILRIADQYSFTCNFEREMFEDLLSSDDFSANVKTMHRVVDGHNVCKFLISKSK